MNHKNLPKAFIFLPLCVTINNFKAGDHAQLFTTYWKKHHRRYYNAMAQFIFPGGLGLKMHHLYKPSIYKAVLSDPTITKKEAAKALAFAAGLYGVSALAIWGAYRASKAIYQSKRASSWREQFWKFYNRKPIEINRTTTRGYFDTTNYFN